MLTVDRNGIQLLGMRDESPQFHSDRPTERYFKNLGVSTNHQVVCLKDRNRKSKKFYTSILGNIQGKASLC